MTYPLGGGAGPRVARRDSGLLGHAAGGACGPHGLAADPGSLARLGNVSLAWDLARSRYASASIARHTGEDFLQIIRGLLDGLLMSVALVGGTAALGGVVGAVIGSLGGGVGAAPGAVVGVRLGLALGMALLEWLGVAFLAEYVAGHLGTVGSTLARGISMAWHSCGTRSEIEAAARVMAEAIGLFFSLLLQAVVAYLSRELAGPAKGRLGPALERLSESRMFRQARGLTEYFNRNYDRLRERYATEPGVEIRPSGPLPDVRGNFRFREFERNGKSYKEGSGRLGVPGRVQTFRETGAQRGVSAGTGDDAGHLIGNRFGATGGPENLSQQNWIANRYGSYKGLEDDWAERLRQGSDIEVTVTDVTRPGEDRPFMRDVSWAETLPDGTVRKEQLTFMNSHTPKSRTAQDIPPTNVDGQGGKVIHYDFQNRKPLP